MKKTIRFTGSLFFLLSLFAACSESDDSHRPPPDYMELIVGEWNYFQHGERVDGIAYMHEYEHECEEEEDFWEFGEEDLFTDNRYDVHCDLSTLEGSYSLSGDTISLKTETGGVIEERVLKIIALNSKLLKVSDPADDEADADIYVFKRMEEHEE